MCGIVGYFSDSESYILTKSIESISHRGPDGNGYWLDSNGKLGLAHTRLSIVDLSSAGQQPMHSECKRFVITFNGEIYNHSELRKELVSQRQSINWNGYSDTETLLACFSLWGVERTLNKLVGMFALALWDKENEVLTLARDRLGEKPLYWGWKDQTFFFGSELKAIKAFPNLQLKVNRNAISLLLQYNYIPAPHTIYQGIEKLPAGHYVQLTRSVQPSDIKPISYWSLKDAVARNSNNIFVGSELDAINILEEKLTKSIEGQMLADVPLGAFLSGGVDSSLIAALMQKQASKPIQTFSIGFNEPEYDEAVYAKAVAKHLGTDHSELYINSKDALNLIPSLASIYCEPFADSSQIPTYLVSQFARTKVTVALSGDGGDELFGGYNTYRNAPRIWNTLKHVPLPFRLASKHIINTLPLSKKWRKLASVLPFSSQHDFYNLMMSHWLNTSGVVKNAETSSVLFTSSEDWIETESFQQWMMFVDTGQYLTDDILVKVDRAAMANSLETRIPLLDHRVLEFANQIPLDMKIRDNQGKWILRQVLNRYVPKELIDRPKKGFSIPIASWLRGPLRDWAEALIAERRLEEEGYFYPKPIRQAWHDHLSRKQDNSLKLWGILMFQAWLEQQ